MKFSRLNSKFKALNWIGLECAGAVISSGASQINPGCFEHFVPVQEIHGSQSRIRRSERSGRMRTAFCSLGLGRVWSSSFPRAIPQTRLTAPTNSTPPPSTCCAVGLHHFRTPIGIASPPDRESLISRWGRSRVSPIPGLGSGAVRTRPTFASCFVLKKLFASFCGSRVGRGRGAPGSPIWELGPYC